jgi:kynurenine formamidase
VEAAKLLIERKVSGLGCDTMSVDTELLKILRCIRRCWGRAYTNSKILAT